MTNEIKEILDDWQKFLSWSYENNDKTIEIYRDNVKKILDYITNLQEEINSLHIINDENRYIINDNSQRIDKAIDYINDLYGYGLVSIPELLNILRGDE